MSVAYTFSPTVDPDPESKWEYAARILKPEIGDGFAQRAPDGINNIPYVLTLMWTELKGTEKDNIINFLQARRGYQSFNYTYPGLSAAVFVCEDYSWTHVTADDYTVSATLKQVFDLV